MKKVFLVATILLAAAGCNFFSYQNQSPQNQSAGQSNQTADNGAANSQQNNSAASNQPLLYSDLNWRQITAQDIQKYGTLSSAAYNYDNSATQSDPKKLKNDYGSLTGQEFIATKSFSVIPGFEKFSDFQSKMFAFYDQNLKSRGFQTKILINGFNVTGVSGNSPDGSQTGYVKYENGKLYVVEFSANQLDGTNAEFQIFFSNPLTITQNFPN